MIHLDAKTPLQAPSESQDPGIRGREKRTLRDLWGPHKTPPLHWSQFGTDRRLLLAVLTRFATGATGCFAE